MTPIARTEERVYLLPTRTMVVEILKTFVDSMDPKVPDTINKALDAPNTPEGDKKRKQMLYKHFFFNYTFQLVAEDAVKLLVGPSEGENDDSVAIEKEKSKRLLQDLMRTFFAILGTLKERRKNNFLDRALKG